MKKILLLFLLAFLIPANAFAAWSYSAQITSEDIHGYTIYTTTITAVSDGSNPDEVSLKDIIEAGSLSYGKLKHSIIYDIATIGVVEPDGVWTLSIDDGDGSSIIDLTGLAVSITAADHNKANTDRGQYPLINNANLGFDYGDIGSNLDSVIVILKSYK